MAKILEKKKMDVGDLARIVEIEQEMAQLHLSYIKKGFTTSEIAETFAMIYFHEFSKTLDKEGLKCLRREQSLNSQMSGSGTTFEATGRMCIRMASGFIRLVTRKLSESEPSHP